MELPQKSILFLFGLLAFNCYSQESTFQPDVSEKTQQLIRATLQPYGFDRTFDYIINFSAKQLQDNPHLNIAVSGSKNEGYYLLINETWFTTLKTDVQQFLLMHEAMHVKLGHIDSPDLDQKSATDMKLSRERELEADHQAVKLLHSYQGAIEFFDSMKSLPARESHPTWSARIAATKKINCSNK